MAALACSAPALAQRPSAPIPVRAGVPTRVHVEDLGVASYKVDSVSVALLPDVDVTLSGDTVVIATSRTDFGVGLLRIAATEGTLSIPLKVLPVTNVTFSWKDTNGAVTASVIGSFNDWNKSALPLQGRDSVYTARIPLESGLYRYRLLVNGKEMVDPANSANDGQSSLLRVASAPEPGLHLQPLAVVQKPDEVAVSFAVDKPVGLKKEITYTALLGDSAVAEKTKISGGEFSVRLSREALAGTRHLRVFVGDGDRMWSDVRTVVLVDGVAGSNPAASFSWHDAVVYSLMVDRFRDGDPDNSKPLGKGVLAGGDDYRGGDLAGVLRSVREGYFDSLAVTTLLLSPVNDNAERADTYSWADRPSAPYDGRRPVNHTDTEARFGTVDNVRDIAREMHLRGGSLLLDFTAHHVHIAHPLVAEQPTWFTDTTLPDGRKNIGLWDEFPHTTWFESFLPTFNFEGSEGAVEYVSNNAMWWIRRTEADGLYFSDTRYVPHALWRRVSAKLRRRFDAQRPTPIFQMGDARGSVDAVRSFVQPGQHDGELNSELLTTAREAFSGGKATLADVAVQLKRAQDHFGDAHLMGNGSYVEGEPRFFSLAGGTADAYKKSLLLTAFTATVPGVPVLFYGDEIAMPGGTGPGDNHAMMSFGDALTPEQREHLRAVGSAMSLRRQLGALRHGDLDIRRADTTLLAFQRSAPGSRVLVVFNASPRATTAEVELRSPLPIRKLSLAGGSEVLPTAGTPAKAPAWHKATAKVSMPPYSFKVFEILEK